MLRFAENQSDLEGWPALGLGAKAPGEVVSTTLLDLKERILFTKGCLAAPNSRSRSSYTRGAKEWVTLGLEGPEHLGHPI